MTNAELKRLNSKIEIRQCAGEKGFFTEILIDGHKLNGVRRFELKQSAGELPILTIDLNASDLSADLECCTLTKME